MAASKPRKRPVTWKTTQRDVDEINSLLAEAGTAVSSAYDSLTEDAGFTPEQARSVLPIVYHFDSDNVQELHSAFTTRADFNREKSRLRRIITASKSKPRKGTLSPAPDNANQLTSFLVYGDELGPTQYMNKETRFLKSQKNKRNLRELAERGIEFVRQAVTDAFGRPVYDENRHKVTVMVPKSRKNMESYMETIQQQPDLALELNADASNGFVELLGDRVPAQEVGSPRQRRRIREQQRKQDEEERRRRETQRERDRFKTLTEWYENTFDDVPKGFTLKELEQEHDFYILEQTRAKYYQIFGSEADADKSVAEMAEEILEEENRRTEERIQRQIRWDQVWKPERLVREVTIDAMDREKTARYFDNYMLIIDTVMPPEMAAIIRPILQRAKDMHPDDQYDLYKYIRDNGEDAATIEFLYLDMSQGAASKALSIVNFWRKDINEWMGEASEGKVDPEDVSEWFENAGMAPQGLLAVGEEFNRRRTDVDDMKKLRGKQRKQWYREGHPDA